MNSRIREEALIKYFRTIQTYGKPTSIERQFFNAGYDAALSLLPPDHIVDANKMVAAPEAPKEERVLPQALIDDLLCNAGISNWQDWRWRMGLVCFAHGYTVDPATDNPPEAAHPAPAPSEEDARLDDLEAIIRGHIDEANGNHAIALKHIAALRARLAEARARADIAEQDARAVKYAVVETIKGTVEGRPTNELNYLQRLRELSRVEEERDVLIEGAKKVGASLEAQLAASEEKAGRMREALGGEIVYRCANCHQSPKCNSSESCAHVSKLRAALAEGKE